MADQQSSAKLIQRAKEANLSMNARMNMAIWLDEYGKDRALSVELTNIDTFILRESMFLNLPIGEFTYNDSGASSDTNRFYSGRILYIGFEYTQSDEATKKNISKGRYRIIGTRIRKTGGGGVQYKVTFIYDALKLFNSIPEYPEYAKNAKSIEVLTDVSTFLGLNFSYDIETADDQLWFNPSMKSLDFIRFVVNHSFINENDFGMFWVDKNGNSKFYGMKNNMKNGIPFYFEGAGSKLKEKNKHVIFNDVFMYDLEKLTDDEVKAKYLNKCYLLAISDQRNNASWVKEFYGDTVDAAVYDPYLKTLFYPSADISTDWAHLTHTISPKQISDGSPAIDGSTDMHTRKTEFKGYTNPDLAQSWDLAPVHNEILRNQFFANRHTLLFNCGKQFPCFGDQDLKIGDILDLDFSRPEEESIIDNGNAVVFGINWMFKKGGDLMMEVRVATDAIHPIEGERLAKNYDNATKAK